MSNLQQIVVTPTESTPALPIEDDVAGPASKVPAPAVVSAGPPFANRPFPQKFEFPTIGKKLPPILAVGNVNKLCMNALCQF